MLFYCSIFVWSKIYSPQSNAYKLFVLSVRLSAIILAFTHVNSRRIATVADATVSLGKPLFMNISIAPLMISMSKREM